MAQYPFSNFKVHVIGYGSEPHECHENAKEKVASDTILTYQKNFLLPIDADVTKQIHQANVEGGGMPVFKNKELGEYLEFKGTVLTSIGGKTSTEAGGFYELIKHLNQAEGVHDTIWTFNKEVGSVQSIEVSDLIDEDDKPLLSMLKSMDILKDDPKDNPSIIYSSTLEYTCNVQKFREYLEEQGILKSRTQEDLVEKVVDDVTPSWLRTPGAEQIPSSKLFKSPILKDISSLRKYTIFGALESAGSTVADPTDQLYGEFFAPLPDVITHMVARPITKLGKTALDYALKSVGATVAQAEALKLKQSTMEGVFPCKFLQEPKESSALHEVLIEANLPGLPSAFYPNPALGSTSQFTVVKINRYNVGEKGAYHHVSIIATSHDKLRGIIANKLLERGKKIKEIMESNGGAWDNNVENLIKFVTKKMEMTWDPNVPAPWPIFSGYIKAADLSLLSTERNKFIRSLGVGVKRISIDQDLRYDGAPVSKLDVWHKREPFRPYLVKDNNKPWDSMYEITIKTKYESFRKYTRAQVARKLRKIRRWKNYNKNFDKVFIQKNFPGSTYAEKLAAAKKAGYGKKGYKHKYGDGTKGDPRIYPKTQTEIGISAYKKQEGVSPVGGGTGAAADFIELKKLKAAAQEQGGYAPLAMYARDASGAKIAGADIKRLGQLKEMYDDWEDNPAQPSGFNADPTQGLYGKIVRAPRPKGPGARLLKKMVSDEEKKKRIREAHIEGLVRMLEFYNKDYRQLWTRTEAYKLLVKNHAAQDEANATPEPVKISIPSDDIILKQLAAELYSASLHDTPVQYHAQRGKKGRLLILVRIPANIWDAYPIAMERFEFDPPYTQDKRAALIPAPLYGGPRPVTDLEIAHTFAETYKWFEKNVLGVRKDVGKGDKYDPKKEIEVDSVMDSILKYYDKKHLKSGKQVIFPDYNAGPLSLRREANNLNLWKYSFREFLEKNDFDFRNPPCGPDGKTKPKGSKGSPSPKSPTDDVMIELGWNKQFQLLYVLFNGQPLKTALGYFREKTGMNNPRTNFLISKSPVIVKRHSEPWTNKSQKRTPWTKWVLTFIYPAGDAIIRPSKKDVKQKDPPKLKKKPLSDAEVKRQMQLLKDMKERDRLLKETKRKRFTVLDDIIKKSDKITKKITDLESAYQQVLDRYGLDQIAETLAACLLERTEDPNEMAINLVLKTFLDPLNKEEDEEKEESKNVLSDILNELPFECMFNVIKDTCSLQYGKETDVPPQIIPGLVNADEKYKKKLAEMAKDPLKDPAFPPNADAKEIIAIRPETAFKESFEADGKTFLLSDYTITDNNKLRSAMPWPDDWKNDTSLVKQWQQYLFGASVQSDGDPNAPGWLPYMAHLHPGLVGDMIIDGVGTKSSVASTEFYESLAELGVYKKGKLVKKYLAVDGVYGKVTELITRWHGEDGMGVNPESGDATIPQGAPWLTRKVFDKMIKGVEEWQKALGKKKAEEAEKKVVVKWGDKNSYVKKIQEFLTLTVPMLLGPDWKEPVYIAKDNTMDSKQPEGSKSLSGVYKDQDGQFYIDYFLKKGKGKGPNKSWKKKKKKFKIDGKYGPTTWQALINFTLNLHEAAKSLAVQAPIAEDLYALLTEDAKGKSVTNPEEFYEHLWYDAGFDLTYSAWKSFAEQVDKVNELKAAGEIDAKTGLTRPEHIILYSPPAPKNYYCKPGTPGPCDDIYEKIIRATSKYELVVSGIKNFPKDPFTTDPSYYMTDPKELKDHIEKLESQYAACTSHLVDSNTRTISDGPVVLWTGPPGELDDALDEMAKKQVRVTEVHGAKAKWEQDHINERIEKLRQNGVKGTPKKLDEASKCNKIRQALIDALNNSYGQDALAHPTEKTPEYIWPGQDMTNHEKSLDGDQGEALLVARTKAMTEYISCIQSATVEARRKFRDRLPEQNTTMSEIEPFPKDLRQVAIQLAVHQRWPSNIKFSGAGNLWNSCKRHCQEDAIKLGEWILTKLGVPPEVQALIGTLAGAVALSAGLVDPDRLPNIPKISLPKGTFKTDPFDPDDGFDDKMKQQWKTYLDEIVKAKTKQLMEIIKEQCEQNKEELEDSSNFPDAIDPPWSPVDYGTIQDRLNQLQDMFNDWGLPIQIGDMPMSPDNAVDTPFSADDMMDGMTDLLTPTQLCACFDGDPSMVVMSVIREYFNEEYPLISTAFITDEDIVEFLRQIGEIVDPAYCEGVENGELLNVIPDDKCLADMIVSNRRKQLEDAAFEPEEIEQQLAKDQEENIEAIKEAMDILNDDYFEPSEESAVQKCKEFAEMTNDLASVNKMLKDVLEMTFDNVDRIYQKDIKFFIPSLILGKNVETDMTKIPAAAIMESFPDLDVDSPVSGVVAILGTTQEGKKGNLQENAFKSVEDAQKNKSKEPIANESSKLGAMMEMKPNPEYSKLVNTILKGASTPADLGAPDNMQIITKAGLNLQALIDWLGENEEPTQAAVEQYISDNGNGEITEFVPKHFTPGQGNFGSSDLGSPNLVVAKNLHNSLIESDRFRWQDHPDGERFIFRLGPTGESITYLVEDVDEVVDNYKIDIFLSSKPNTLATRRFGFEDATTVYPWITEYLKSNKLQDFSMESSQKTILRNFIEKAMYKFGPTQKQIEILEASTESWAAEWGLEADLSPKNVTIFNAGNEGGDETVRELYRNMNVTIMRRFMKEIASSPLFMKNTLQKLNLAPNLEATTDDCGIPFMQLGVEKVPNLLNVEEEIEEAIEDYKQRELDKCENPPFDEDREPLEEIIAETTLRMLCKTFIIETLLKTVFSLSQFSAEDCLSDDFIIEFITKQFIRHAKRLDVYEDILDTAQRMVVRTRHNLYYQEPKVIPPKFGSHMKKPKVLGGERLPNTRTKLEALEHILTTQIEEVGAEFSGMLTSVVDTDKIDMFSETGLLNQITLSEPIHVLPYNKLWSTTNPDWPISDTEKKYYRPKTGAQSPPLPGIRWNKTIDERPHGMLQEDFDEFEKLNNRKLILNDLVEKDGGFVLEKYIKIEDNIVFAKKYQISEFYDDSNAALETKGGLVDADTGGYQPAWDAFVNSIPAYNGNPEEAPAMDSQPYVLQGTYPKRKLGLSGYCNFDEWQSYMKDLSKHVYQEYNDSIVKKKKITENIEDFESEALQAWFDEWGDGPQVSDPDVVDAYQDWVVLYPIMPQYKNPGNSPSNSWPIAGTKEYANKNMLHGDDRLPPYFQNTHGYNFAERWNDPDVGVGEEFWFLDVKHVVDFWASFPWEAAAYTIGAWNQNKESGYADFEGDKTNMQLICHHLQVATQNLPATSPVPLWFMGSGVNPTVATMKYADKWINDLPDDHFIDKNRWNDFLAQFKDFAAKEAANWPYYAIMRNSAKAPPESYYSNLSDPESLFLNEYAISKAISPLEEVQGAPNLVVIKAYGAGNTALTVLTEDEWEMAEWISGEISKAVQKNGQFEEYFQKIWVDEYEKSFEEAYAEFEKEVKEWDEDKKEIMEKKIQKQKELDELEKLFDMKAKHAGEIFFTEPLEDLWKIHGFFKKPWKFGMRLTYVLPDGPNSIDAPNKTVDSNDEIRKLIKALTALDLGQAPGANGNFSQENLPPKQYHHDPNLIAQPTLYEQYEHIHDEYGTYREKYMFPIVEVEQPISEKIVKEKTLNSAINGGALYLDFFDAIPQLKEKIVKTPEFRMLFNHVVPTRRLLSLTTLYNVLSIKYDGPTKMLFGSTKNLLFKTMRIVSGKDPDMNDIKTKESDQIVSEKDFAKEKPMLDDFLSMIWDLFLKTPPRIIKGVAEIADPNIAISKKIYQGMQLVVKAIPDKLSEKAVQEKLDTFTVDQRATLKELKDKLKEDGAKTKAIEAQIKDAEEQIKNIEEKTLEEVIDPINKDLAKAKKDAKKVIDDFPFAVLSLSLLPSMLPFGVGFPPPPLGPGIGPPLTPFGAAYLSLGLHKDPPDDQDEATQVTKEQMKSKLCRDRLREARALGEDNPIDLDVV